MNSALDLDAIRAEIKGIDDALETFDAVAAEGIAKVRQDMAALVQRRTAETAAHNAKVAAARAANEAAARRARTGPIIELKRGDTDRARAAADAAFLALVTTGRDMTARAAIDAAQLFDAEAAGARRTAERRATLETRRAELQAAYNGGLSDRVWRSRGAGR